MSSLPIMLAYLGRIFWESTKFGGHTDMTEPWYGTQYSLEKLTGSMIEQWMEKAPNEHLHLPVPNSFIPTNLSLKNFSDKASCPLRLRKSSYSQLWYKPDTTFFTPKASVSIDFSCPYARSSPESTILTSLFTRLLTDYLNEFAYYAEIAGLFYGISSHFDGFQVSVGGYSNKMWVLLETIIRKIVKFEVKPDRFAVIKELMTKEYENFKYQQPYEQAMYHCSLILEDQLWSWNDLFEVLPHVNANDLVSFYPSLLSRVFLECFIAGNIEQNEAESMIQHIEDIVFKGPQPISRALFASERSASRVIKLDRGIDYVYTTEGLNPNDENSALVHYIQVHRDDFVLNVKLQLLSLIAKQQAFHQLRSVEQLGYLTQLSRRYDSGIHGLQFIIQSSIKDPKYIGSRIEAFLKMFEHKLHEISDDDFKKKVNALIDMKLEKPKNLWEETEFFWWEISGGTLKFDRIEQEVAALKQLTQKDLIDFFHEHINVGAPGKKSLSVQVYGSAHSSQYKAERNNTVEETCHVQIEDIFSFKRSRPLYGSF